MLVFLGTESGGFIYLHILYLYSGKRERPGHEANNKLLSSSFTCRSPSAKLCCACLALSVRTFLSGLGLSGPGGGCP